MIGVQLPAPMVKKIGKIAEALSTNRSGAIRFLVEAGLDSGHAILVLRQGETRTRLRAMRDLSRSRARPPRAAIIA
jgi:hypothetical protein